MKQLVSVKEAQEIVLDSVRRGDTEWIEMTQSLDRILADSMIAETRIPPFDNSALDGYAVRLEDVAEVPSLLTLAGETAAGSWPSRSLERGECIRIMTGAPIPKGADCIVPLEWTTVVDDRSVRFDRSPPPAYAVRRAGEDVDLGDVTLSAGTLVTPPVIGMLASLGQARIRVARRPRVSIISTGSEIVSHEAIPGPGEIRNSNGPALCAQSVAAGAELREVSIAADNPRVLQEHVARGLESDVLVLSGGVSVGAYDHVQDVLRAAGVEILFWKVRQRPGKPLLFGVGKDTLVFGLPGNPVSASVCFDRYVRPAIHAFLGRITPDRERFTAVLSEAIQKVEGLQYFARGTFLRTAETISVRPSGSQSSAVYSALVDANCIIHLPENVIDPPAGSEVVIEPLTW